MNVTVNNVTQGIVFINERPPGYRSNCPGDDIIYTGIELCEVRVMGKLGFFLFFLNIHFNWESTYRNVSQSTANDYHYLKLNKITLPIDNDMQLQ